MVYHAEKCLATMQNSELTFANDPFNSQRKVVYMDEMRKQMNLSEQLLRSFSNYTQIVHCMKETVSELNSILNEYYVDTWPQAEEWKSALCDMVSVWNVYENDLEETLNCVLCHLELFESIEKILNQWLDAKDALKGFSPPPPPTPEGNLSTDTSHGSKGTLKQVASEQMQCEMKPEVEENLETFRRLDEELEEKFRLVVASRIQFVDECIGRHFKSMVILFQGLAQVCCVVHDIATSLPCQNPCIPIGCHPCPPQVRFSDVCPCPENYDIKECTENEETNECCADECQTDSTKSGKRNSPTDHDIFKTDSDECSGANCKARCCETTCDRSNCNLSNKCRHRVCKEDPCGTSSSSSSRKQYKTNNKSSSSISKKFRNDLSFDSVDHTSTSENGCS